MKYEAQTITLPSSLTCTIRSAEKADARAMIEHLLITNEESYFLMRYPEEIHTTLEDEESIIEDYSTSSNKLLLLAVVDNIIAGTCGIEPILDRMKIRHRAHFGIGVKKAYWNKGIGSLLLTRILEHAKTQNFTQIELGVYADNDRARHVYQKHGFTEWGCIKNAYKLKDNTYRDEIYMGLVF